MTNFGNNGKMRKIPCSMIFGKKFLTFFLGLFWHAKYNGINVKKTGQI